MSAIDKNKIDRLAKQLRDAEKSRVGCAPLTNAVPELSSSEAYQIQLINIEKKIKDGRKITGKKIGLTSVAMQQLLGVDQPDYGHLLEDMAYENGSVVPFQRVIQPRVEAEIAFVLKKDLIGPKVTPLDVLLATDYVVPAFEIVDSRIDKWKIKLEDTIADNASSGLYLLGENRLTVDQLDLASVGMALYKNDELVNTGVGAAALGHPAACVAWLANKLHEFNITLQAGEIILSGALSAAVDGKPGDRFAARFAHLGEVSFEFSI